MDAKDDHNAVFSGLRILRDIGLRVTPERPTAMMCAAGAAAAGVDDETVRRVYSAMLLAAAESPLCGDAAIH